MFVDASTPTIRSATGTLNFDMGSTGPDVSFVNATRSLSLGGPNAPAIIGDNTTNLGIAGFTFNDVYANYFRGIATSAQYADLAENYVADAAYEPGTVLEIGGIFEVTVAQDSTNKIAGVVSTNPAYLMNSACKGDHVVALALQGRTPCKVIGNVSKGDMLISAGNGYAKSSTTPQVGTIIGKSLENFTGNRGIIEVLVGKI
jgi:hypothetical protein